MEHRWRRSCGQGSCRSPSTSVHRGTRRPCIAPAVLRCPTRSKGGEHHLAWQVMKARGFFFSPRASFFGREGRQGERLCLWQLLQRFDVSPLQSPFFS
ncbi:hypothetical protein TRSC58_07221 [Trypanosoma rangeli SC58]|uniref:Uncharacterized protein n=1 Tax=Trypanosoma rangeli SC58 TaxID=429131 RepID=A0A061IS63_TRYRA|nr:hypothetical protein TRSC58_07221 [Trypanosoma rangeli SC58]